MACQSMVIDSILRSFVSSMYLRTKSAFNKNNQDNCSYLCLHSKATKAGVLGAALAYDWGVYTEQPSRVELQAW